jgi:hypothetical protein
MTYRMRLAALTLPAIAGIGAQAFIASASPEAAIAATAATAATAAAVTISPLQGTPTATAQTQISFLGAAAKTLSSIAVLGSSSGRHGGRLRSYSSATGASFVPSKPFVPGERVTVRATWTSSTTSRRTLSDSFTIARPGEASQTEPADTPGAPADIQSFQSRPELHPPTVTVPQPAGAGVAPGYVLATPSLGPGQHGPMIFDNAGELVWFHPLEGSEAAADLQTQTFNGKNMLTWWQGHTLQRGYGLGEDVIANANYKTVEVVKAGNGLQADAHGFTLTPSGAAFLTAYSPVQTSGAGGGGEAASATALDGVVQEIDVHTGLVMWEWHSLGHAALTGPLPKPAVDPSQPEPASAQALPGGGSMTGNGSPTGGGGQASFAETGAQGTLVFAGQLPTGESSYRIYREPWSAQPSEAPAIAARSAHGATAVYASWNGATTVTAWQLLTGSSPSGLKAVSTTPKDGFETTIPAPAATFVQVRALSASGKVLASSKAVQPSSA